jgi:type IV pilus assembly protein PilN
MRIGINLASRRYEDAGRFFKQWVPALVGLAFVTLVLVGLALAHYNELRGLDREIAQKREQIAQLEKERSEAEAFLARPENSGTRDQAQFLNDLFKKKSFSWTQVLSELERMMPAGVQVVSIKPELDQASGKLKVAMTVATPRRDNAIELIRKLEDSEHFQTPLIQSESERAEGENRVQVLISADYVPTLPRSVK